MSKTTEVIPLQKVKRAIEKAIFNYASELKQARKDYFNEFGDDQDDSEFFEYGLIRGLEMLAQDLDIEINTSKINY